MGRSVPYLARTAAAFFAVVAQLVFAGSAHFCDMPCCASTSAAKCCQVLTRAPADIDSQCPLCREAEKEQEQPVPCRCQLDARHDAAATSVARTSIDLRAIDQVVVAAINDVAARTAAQSIRRIVDENREIPYRPPRIEFGVWRN